MHDGQTELLKGGFTRLTEQHQILRSLVMTDNQGMFDGEFSQATIKIVHWKSPFQHGLPGQLVRLGDNILGIGDETSLQRVPATAISCSVGGG